MSKNNNRKSKAQIDWHSGFAGGLELVFRDYKDQLAIEREHSLSKQPLRIDFLLVKVNPGTAIDNAIGRFFKTYNIVEYKNPYDELNIDVVWKVIGYAALYKGLGHSKDVIPSSELTITIFRHSKPHALLKQLINNGYIITCHSPGVYSVSGIIAIPIYIVVTRELKEDIFKVLRIMSKNADIDDIKAFITEASKFNVPGDKGNADAVLQVSSTANKTLFEIMKGEDQTMCEALKELMADELKQAKEDGVSEATKKFATIINEKDKTIIDQDKTISEQDKTISEQDKTISEQEALLKQYKEKFGEL
ncbi:MAG: SlyX family protein [Butyrivibrio sp.]|nr:SlyX family protein [Butyrivibrio sp.]